MSWAQNGHFFAIIILKSTLLAEIAVLEAEEVEHAVDADGVEALLGVGHHAWLSVERYTESGLAEHGQVVCSVAHGDGLCEIHLFHLRNELQQFCLTMSVYNFAEISSGKFAVFVYFELVGIYVVDAMALYMRFAMPMWVIPRFTIWVN